MEAEIERKMNKASLVTLWVDPAEFQIVKYTFDNMDFGFLPGRWLVRVDDASASMTMARVFEGVWLPSRISMGAGLSLASGGYRFQYRPRVQRLPQGGSGARGSAATSRRRRCHEGPAVGAGVAVRRGVDRGGSGGRRRRPGGRAGGFDEALAEVQNSRQPHHAGRRRAPPCRSRGRSASHPGGDRASSPSACGTAAGSKTSRCASGIAR